MAEILEQFTSSLAGEELSEETVSAYTRDVQQFITWLKTKETSVRQATPCDIDGYAESLHRGQDGGKSLSSASVYRKLIALRRFYDFLAGLGLMDRNPVRTESTRMFVPDSGLRTPTLTEVELARLFSTADLSAPIGIRNHAMLLVMVFCSLAVHEVQALNVNNLDLNSRNVQVVTGDSEPHTVEVPSKVNLGLRRWVNARQVLMGRTDGPLFIRVRSGCGGGENCRLSRRAIRKAVDRHLRWAGLKAPGVSCRSLRVSGLVLGLAEGANAGAMAERLDISTRTVKVYERISQRLLQGEV